MTDRNPEAADRPSSPVGPPPGPDAHPLEVARFWRALGLIPLPIRSPAEVERDLPAKLEQWHAEHPHATDDDLEHRKAAIDRSLRKRPKVLWSGGRWVDSPPTDEQLAHPDWWGGDEGEFRPIFLLTGPGTGLAAIDIDTYKGASPDPWAGLASVVVTTPRGALQAWYAEADVKTDNDELGPGLDRRGRGGGVAAPSGRATPGRTVQRWAWPLAPFPDEAMPKTSAGATPLGGMPRIPAALAGPSSSMSRAIVGPVGDGHRTGAAKEIVGMLCRPTPLPEDAIVAVLGLIDQWLASSPEAHAAIRPVYETALRAAVCRPVEMVEQLVAVWAELRCDPPWRPDAGPAKQVARSLWQTAAAAEAGRAVSERMLDLPATPDTAQTPPAAPPPGDDPDEDPIYRLFMPSEAQVYTHERHIKRRNMPRVPIATLPGWRRRGDPRHADAPHGHGLGRQLDKALGGLRPGRMLGVCAPSAKGGKTAFLQQLVDGLSMLSIERLDDPGSGPLFLCVYVSEMDADSLAERSLSRYLGVTQGLFQGEEEVAGLYSLVDQLFYEEPDDIFQESKAFRRFFNLGAFRKQGIAEGAPTITNIAALVTSYRQYLAWRLQREIIVVMVFDPYQRRIDETLETTASETATVKLIRELTDEHEWITLLASDTTKAAATGEIDPKLAPGVVNSTLVRGTYALQHNVDGLIGLVVEQTELDEALARVYVSHTRYGRGSTRPLEFSYWRSLGRFVPHLPIDSAPVPPTMGPAVDENTDPATIPSTALRMPASASTTTRPGRGAHLRSKGRATG